MTSAYVEVYFDNESRRFPVSYFLILFFHLHLYYLFSIHLNFSWIKMKFH